MNKVVALSRAASCSFMASENATSNNTRPYSGGVNYVKENQIVQRRA